MNRTALLIGIVFGAAAAALISCGGGETQSSAMPGMPAAPPATGPAAEEPFSLDVAAPSPTASSSVTPRLTVFASGLASPWALAFLPDGRLLVTQKGGTLVLVSADGQSISAPIAGVPAVDAGGQGGLLDVAVDPQFGVNRRIFLTYSELDGSGANGTAVARATLSPSGTALENVEVIFRQTPKKTGTTAHYGSRIAFRADGTLFVTLGERSAYADEAQSLTSHLGKVVRINPDGSLPADNPFASQGGNAGAVWSYGHRNPQAAAIHPGTGELWIAEHGPQGGDEVNLALAGRNFGWPRVSYGCNYGAPVGTACRIGGGTHAAPYTPPLAYWYPTSTAPGGMMFYTGARFPEWQGSLFVGGLAGRTLWRFKLDGNAIVGQEPYFSGQHEIRDIRQGPDGWIYLISRNASQILRVER